MPEFTLRIDGMHCGSCVRRVSQALASTEGIQVKEVRVGAARLSFHIKTLRPSILPSPLWPRPATPRTGTIDGRSRNGRASNSKR
jgi:copper chaperone CopZ